MTELPIASSVQSPGRLRFAQTFGLDLRSIALLRIGTGATLLLDLATRARDLRAHYSDDGAFPRELAMAMGNPWHVSLHFAVGEWMGQAVLFAVAAVAAICLLLGIRTRMACAASWVLLASLQARNTAVLYGIDNLLRLIVFWSIFLPLGARFSVDRLRTASKGDEPTTFASAGTAFYTTQIVLLYLFAVLIKLDDITWRDGSALAYALRCPEFVSGLGKTLVENVPLVRALSYGSLVVELVGPILLIVPLWKPVTRSLGVLSIVGLHLGIAATMRVGIFPVGSILAVIPFVPSAAWDRVFPRVVGWMPDGVRAKVARAAQATRERLLPIAARVPASLDAPPAPLSQGATTFASVCMALVLAWNVSTYRPALVTGPRWTKLGRITLFLTLDQNWNMFSRPITEGGWYVMPGRLRSGQPVDLVAREPREVSWDPPAMISEMYPTARWKEYFLVFQQPDSMQQRSYFGTYLCRTWNAEHRDEDTLEAFKIYFMSQTIEAWKPPSPPERKMLWEHECQEGALAKWTSEL